MKGEREAFPAPDVGGRTGQDRMKAGLCERQDESSSRSEGMCAATKYLVIIAAAKWPSAFPIVHHTARQKVPTQAAGAGVGEG